MRVHVLSGQRRRARVHPFVGDDVSVAQLRAMQREDVQEAVPAFVRSEGLEGDCDGGLHRKDGLVPAVNPRDIPRRHHRPLILRLLHQDLRRISPAP